MGEKSVAVRTIPVGPVTVDLIDDDRICAHLAKGETFEPRSLARWAEMCSSVEWGFALDVGAYSGLYSIAAKKLGCTVVAFEPMPQMIERFKANCDLNEVDPMLIPKAASDQDGESVMHHTAVNFTSGASMERKTGISQPVKTIKIDTACFGVTDITAIKIDVERHEAAVLRGARETLERCKPKLLVEALDENLKAAVLRELPGYRLIEVLDVRNLYLEPV